MRRRRANKKTSQNKEVNVKQRSVLNFVIVAVMLCAITSLSGIPKMIPSMAAITNINNINNDDKMFEKSTEPESTNTYVEVCSETKTVETEVETTETTESATTPATTLSLEEQTTDIVEIEQANSINNVEIEPISNSSTQTAPEIVDDSHDDFTESLELSTIDSEDSKTSEESTNTETTESEETTCSSWSGPVLTAWAGTVQGPSGKETYYNLYMGNVVDYMHDLGYVGDYWVRDDGVKMFGDYIMCAANLDIRPKGTILETSLGLAIVCDTGGFAYSNEYQIDIAVNW